MELLSIITLLHEPKSVDQHYKRSYDEEFQKCEEELRDLIRGEEGSGWKDEFRNTSINFTVNEMLTKIQQQYQMSPFLKDHLSLCFPSFVRTKVNNIYLTSLKNGNEKVLRTIRNGKDSHCSLTIELLTLCVVRKSISRDKSFCNHPAPDEKKRQHCRLHVTKKVKPNFLCTGCDHCVSLYQAAEVWN